MSAQPIHLVSQPEQAAILLHPTRVAILRELEQPNSAAGLAKILHLPRQKLNYHLRELERGGFLELVEEKRRGSATERIVRASATSYLISPEVLGRLGAEPSKVQDRFSLAYLVATAAKAIADLAHLRRKGEQQGKPVPTLSLNAQISFASPKHRHDFAEELANEVARLTAKYHAPDASGARASTFIVGMYPTPTDPEPKTGETK